MQTTQTPLNNSLVYPMQLPEVMVISRSSSATMGNKIVKAFINIFIITQIICHSSNAQQLNPLISNATAPEVAQQFAKNQPSAYAVNSSASNPLDLEPIIQTISSVYEEVKPGANGSQEATEPVFLNTEETTTKNNSELATATYNDNKLSNKQKKLQSEMAADDNKAFHDTNDLLEYDDIGDIHLKSPHIKNRRQADNYVDSGNDWWTRLMNKPTTELPKVERVLRRNSAREPDLRESYSGSEEQPYKKVVYQEQPVTRNPIIVVKNQLATIESQRKLLISRSIKQLYQLDTRLIDSYKTYMKKKQPLYAGMLYSTRGFVIKMAKEVKQSKNVLDSMSKQVQGVLKQKMANRTLVKEYNKLTESSGDAGLPVDESRRLLSHEPITSGSRTGRAFGGLNPGANEVYQAPRKMRIRYTISVHEVNLKKQLAKIQSLVDRINGSTYELNMVINDINYLFKIAVREVPKKVTPQPQPPVKEPPVKEAVPAIKTTKFIQELDKHSPSSYNSKLGRKSMKSPIKIFMEKYGKQKSNDIVNATTNTNAELVESSRSNLDNLYTPDLPEMQPLFDASSFVYTEPKDLTDYGFDYTNGGTAN